MNASFDVFDVNIETERLVLKPWTLNDIDDFFEYASVDGVGQMAGWSPHENKEKSLEILKVFIAERRVLAIYHKADEKIVGSLGIELYNEEKLTEFADYKGREIGYVLAKPYWGQGLMAEAVNAVVKYLFDELDYDFLLCGHYAFNKQSARVQEKCGFVPYRNLTFTTRMGTEEKGTLEILLNPRKSIDIKRVHPESLVYKPLVLTAEQMWKASGLEGDYDAWEFGSDAPDKLAGLVLKGDKKATTSIFKLYELEGEELPKVGEYSVILNSGGYAVCIIRDDDITVKRFCDVDEAYAYHEGEGDKSLKYWKDVHWEVFTQELAEEMGEAFKEQDYVVCESFEVVYK